MKHFRKAIPIALAVSAVAAAPAAAGDDTAAALDAAAPEVLQESVPATITPSSRIAMKSVGDAGTVTVADDPRAGLTLDPATGGTVKVGLPATDDAVKLDEGAVAYEGRTTDTAVVANADGATVLATMNGRSAPTRYVYPLKLARGQKVRATPNGGFVVVEADGRTVALGAAPPWAKDANGRAVPVRYEVRGQTVTMVVDHRRSGLTYPIVADPRFVWGWTSVTVYLNRGETKGAIAWGSWALGFVPGGLAVRIIAAAVGAPATQAAANWVVDRGYCLAIWKSYWNSWVVPWAYRC